MATVDIIIPSCRTPELTYLAVASFEYFKQSHTFRYIVVENSNDESYRDRIISNFPNTIWVQNQTNLTLSNANAIALTRGLAAVSSDYVFMCHNDVAVCHESWMNYLVSKLDEGHSLIGMCFDAQPGRIKAAHSSGILVKSEIAKAVSLYPVYDDSGTVLLDVCDSLTKYCRDNGLPYFICNNTFNDPKYLDLIPETKYREFHVDRALNNKNEVIYLHLGRGHSKYNDQYYRPNRILMPEWIEFVTSLLDIEELMSFQSSRNRGSITRFFRKLLRWRN